MINGWQSFGQKVDSIIIGNADIIIRRCKTLHCELNIISPRDKHNQKLAEQVHPSGWVNPEPAARYNLVVIGAGTAGLVSAAVAAGLGRRWR